MQEYKVIVDNCGAIKYYKPGTDELHRIDGPAVEYANGTRSWYQDGKLHRLDGPTVECPDGTKFWHQNGKLHRLDGPAVEYASGSKYWYQNNKLHRIGGPAIQDSCGSGFWCQDGVCHRTDGPAIERADGTVEYYINGKQLTLAQFKNKKISLSFYSQVCYNINTLSQHTNGDENETRKHSNSR